jgi:3,5-epimerase/4-reductase
MKILIFGKGYIGGRCADAWQEKGHEVVLSNKMIQSIQDALEELKVHEPECVFNAAGVTGKPNVDWCEDNQLATIQGNTILPIHLAHACQEHGVHMLHIGSGCVFYDESPHEDGKWREDDHANPSVVYSRAKYSADLVLSTLPNVAIGRIRMPIDWVPSPRNLIDKLANYPTIIDVNNSGTVIEDMIDVFLQLMEKRAEGIFHVTNPGKIKHRETMGFYKQYVDPDWSAEWISNEELVERGLATKGRSNNELASDRLAELGITMRPIHEAMEDTMKKYAEAKKIEVRDEDKEEPVKIEVDPCCMPKDDCCGGGCDSACC